MITQIKKKHLFFTALTITVLSQLAATIDRDHLLTGVELEERIRAFRKNGAEKMIDTVSYQKEIVIEYANSLLGVRHKMGGVSPSGVDCSGLVKLAHAQSGINLPHSSQEQARYGRILSSEEELQRGDLVFFHSTYNTSNLVTHSGIYLGDNSFIHTSDSNGEHYLFATRLKG